MKTKMLSKNVTYKSIVPGKLSYIAAFVGVLLLINLGIFGCKGTTINPTEPLPIEPLPETTNPTPTTTGTPDGEGTPTPSTPSSGSYDSYAETPDDPTIKTLEVDDSPYIIMMDYTGDIDWYKIQIPENADTLNISLTDIPEKSDYDIIAYDSDLRELENGISAQSGNASEHLSLSPVESLIYLQIYSYSGYGEATLTLTIEKTEEEDETEEEITQLTYEEVLSTYYPLYPRGTSSGILEHSVETIETEKITCQTADSLLSGELTIGNYAHVKRELLELADYVDGWAVVVFNGPVSVLDELTITIRVTIFAPELDLEVEAPVEMEIEGYDYLISETGNDIYYISQSYGDFWSNSSDDIRISSGIIGDLGILGSNDIFTQQVEVQWSLTHSDGTNCSGRTKGEQIVDFEIVKHLFLSDQWGSWSETEQFLSPLHIP